MQIKDYFNNLSNVLSAIDRKSINQVAELIKDRIKDNGTIYTFGNGGSGAIASHFVIDLSKYLNAKSICLNDNVPSITAIANDYNYESVFIKQLAKFKITKKDIVIGISGSGKSENVLKAILYANKSFAYTVGLCGFNGGELKSISQYSIHIPINDMQICEDCFQILCHLIVRLVSDGKNI